MVQRSRQYSCDSGSGFIESVLIVKEVIYLFGELRANAQCLEHDLPVGFLIFQRVNGYVFNQNGANHDPQLTALDTYLQRLPMILDKIEALLRHHFDHDPDAIYWGRVGGLGLVDQALDDLLAIFDGQAE